jgi:hypothetical protein
MEEEQHIMSNKNEIDKILVHFAKQMAIASGISSGAAKGEAQVYAEKHQAKARQYIESILDKARIDEINNWFDMPKHYPGEEYRDEPFAKVKCKTPGRIQYQVLDSRFTYAIKTRLEEFKGNIS